MNERDLFAIPDVAHDALGRHALSAWLDENARVPLRIVVGQPGAGKTTAVAAWARAKHASLGWITLHDGASRRWLVAALTDVLAHFQADCTIVVDDVDRGSAEAREFLAQLYLQADDRITFIYLARGFASVEVTEGEQRGVVAVAGGSLLRFDAEEVALYCEALAVPCSPLDTAWVAARTHGWALAVTGIARAAQLARRPLIDALPMWQTANAAVVARTIDEAARSAPARDARELLDLVEGDERPPTSLLRRLERVGLFVERIEGRFELNPIVAGPTEESQPPVLEINPLVVEMFGRFRVVHDGADVRFARRRDAQIVQYLLLQPYGRATREKLVRTFWPESDPQLGAQGLRTACSAIRRALAGRVGPQNVDRYLFSAPAQIGLRFEAVVSSAHRFAQHAELAIAAEARGAMAFAQAHWAAALRLYTAPVLSGEPVAWWIERQAEAFAALASRARRAIRELGPARVR